MRPPRRHGNSATTPLVSSLMMFGSNIVAVSLPWWLGASFADVQWAIGAYVLIVIRERETALMCTAAPAKKMPCKLIDCRDPL